jgi:hypothetical protein
MSARGTDFDYVAARIHARHGARPDGRTWSRLAPYPDAASYLNAMRGTALEAVSRDLGAADGIHDVERALREVWTAYVDDIARWHGSAFQPAFRLIGDLPRLPERAYLDAGAPAMDWLSGPADFDADAPAAFGTWRARLRAVLPGGKCATAADAALGAMLPADGALPEARSLRSASERLFRKTSDPFVAVLAHLGCVASDLMELRGELAVRLVFGAVPATGR